MRPSYQQIQALADFLSQNPGIAQGSLRTAHGKFITKKKWKAISSSLNALGGVQKDGRAWAKYWADKKCSLKKLLAQQAISMKQTGDAGSDDLRLLSPIDLRLIDIIKHPDVPVDCNTYNDQSQETEHSQIVEEFLASPFNIVTDSLKVVKKERSIRRNSEQRASSSLDQNVETFEVPDQTVEEEDIMARAFSLVSENMSKTNTALGNLSTAIREGAQTIADALNKIADAIAVAKTN